MAARYSRSTAAIVLALTLASPAFPQTPARKATSLSARPVTREPISLTERERAIHALNRLTFGPRPGDIDAVLSKGVDAWIEDQLHPESIDDSALNARLAPYATAKMSLKQLAEMFPSDGTIRQVIAGKRPMPADPNLIFIYSVAIARVKQRDADKGAPPNTPPSTASGVAMTSMTPGGTAPAGTMTTAPTPTSAGARTTPAAPGSAPASALEPSPEDRARSSATTCWCCSRTSGSPRSKPTLRKS